MNIGREIIPAPQNDMVKLTDNIIANKWNSEVFASKKIFKAIPRSDLCRNTMLCTIVECSRLKRTFRSSKFSTPFMCVSVCVCLKCSVCDLRIPSAKYISHNHYPHYFLSYYPFVVESFWRMYLTFSNPVTFSCITLPVVILCLEWSHKLTFWKDSCNPVCPCRFPGCKLFFQFIFRKECCHLVFPCRFPRL